MKSLRVRRVRPLARFLNFLKTKTNSRHLEVLHQVPQQHHEAHASSPQEDQAARLDYEDDEQRILQGNGDWVYGYAYQTRRVYNRLYQGQDLRSTAGPEAIFRKGIT